MSAAEERALQQLNLRRETWCQVEVNRPRRERRHHRDHLRTSPVLLSALTAGPQRRPAGSERPPAPPPPPERRHFQESNRSQLV